MRYFARYFIDFGAIALVYALVLFRRWRARGRDVLVVRTLMYAYLTLVLLVTLMPVIASLPFMLNHTYEPMNMTPFVDVFEGRGDFVRQVALNVVMTAPFGFLLPLCRRAGFGKTVLWCLLMSLFIELIQPLMSGGRSSDITDIITNTAGGAIGYGLHVLFRPVTDCLLERLKKAE